MDNVLKTTISLTIPSSTALKLMLSAFKGSPQPAVQADWIRVLSYPASGTFTSTVFDAGRAATWGTASWTATLPANTTLVIQTRSGNTATPDSSWSSWTTVGNGGTVASPSSRYLQYQVLFTTTDSTATAVLSDVTFNWS